MYTRSKAMQLTKPSQVVESVIFSKSKTYKHGNDIIRELCERLAFVLRVKFNQSRHEEKRDSVDTALIKLTMTVSDDETDELYFEWSKSFSKMS